VPRGTTKYTSSQSKASAERLSEAMLIDPLSSAASNCA
jgi:hypothetical protein